MEPAKGADYERKVRAARGALAAHLRDVPLEELLVAAKLASELIASPGWAVIAQLLEARKSHIVDSVVHGPLLTQPEYAAQTAMVSGIDQALYAGEVVVAVAQEREQAERDKAEQSAEGR